MIIDFLFLLVGMGFSLFYGFSSYRVFTYPHTDEVYKKEQLRKFEVTKRARFHEGWVHFVCSSLGWLCIYLLYTDLFKTGIENFSMKSMEINHFLIFLIGVWGIIGFLPRAMWNLTSTILEISKKLTGN